VNIEKIGAVVTLILLLGFWALFGGIKKLKIEYY